MVEIVYPPNGSQFCFGPGISLHARAIDTNGFIAQVSFYANGAQIGQGFPTDTNIYSLNLEGFVLGNHVITAVAVDNQGLSSTSAPVAFTVLAPAQVDAGSPVTLLLTNQAATIQLRGRVMNGGASVTCLWTQVSGPSQVSFADRTVPNTTATFSKAGLYLLRLIGGNSCGTDSADLTVSVVTNVPPLVDAGPDRVVYLPQTVAYLAGVVRDDGLLRPAVCWWTDFSAPAGATTVGFTNISTLTTLVTNLTVPGRYVFRLYAQDGLATNYDECVVTVLPAGSRTWTYDADFEEGVLMNVNYEEVPDQLQLNRTIEPFPYVWIACSGRGTIVRIDAMTGEVLGEYRTGPQATYYSWDGITWRKVENPNPSRTTVDKYGNVWVANRHEVKADGIYAVEPYWGKCGSITRVGLVIGGTRGRLERVTNGTEVVTNFIPDPKGEYLKPPFKYCTAIDRDGDTYIRTSFGLTNVLDWPGPVTNGASLAKDECILNFTLVPCNGTRTVAIDANNNVWVGGRYNNHMLVNGDTGELVPGSVFSHPD
ncbi:MAG: Ig-like domain-containing protein, partial [Verrucomicrobiae bacterium]|nr:Ig-like domain-containing protein [Verrucomicrobiae bacterium]